jgi:hypothetical protein
MSIRNLALVLFLISFSSLSNAGIRKFNVPPNGVREVVITTTSTTFLPVDLMFDNVNTDLDIFIVDNVTDEVACASLSTERQIEKCQCGLLPNTDYSILIQNSQGPGSPARLYIGDEISVTSTKSIQGAPVEDAHEISLQDLPVRVRDQIKRLTSRK